MRHSPMGAPAAPGGGEGKKRKTVSFGGVPVGAGEGVAHTALPSQPAAAPPPPPSGDATDDEARAAARGGLEHMARRVQGMSGRGSRLDVRPRSFHNLFKDPCGVVIPLFQRAYCWNERLAAGWFRDVKNATPWHQPEGVGVGSHPTGKVVLRKDIADRDGSEYICCLDGQQRTTTALLCLTAIRDAAWGYAESCEAVAEGDPTAASAVPTTTTTTSAAADRTPVDPAAAQQCARLAEDLDKLIFKDTDASRRWVEGCLAELMAAAPAAAGAATAAPAHVDPNADGSGGMAGAAAVTPPATAAAAAAAAWDRLIPEGFRLPAATLIPSHVDRKVYLELTATGRLRWALRGRLRRRTNATAADSAARAWIHTLLEVGGPASWRGDVGADAAAAAASLSSTPPTTTPQAGPQPPQSAEGQQRPLQAVVKRYFDAAIAGYLYAAPEEGSGEGVDAKAKAKAGRTGEKAGGDVDMRGGDEDEAEEEEEEEHDDDDDEDTTAETFAQPAFTGLPPPPATGILVQGRFAPQDDERDPREGVWEKGWMVGDPPATLTAAASGAPPSPSSIADRLTELANRQLNGLYIVNVEIMTEAQNMCSLCQVFLWLQEKTLFGVAGMLYNKNPGINFRAVDMVRNLLLSHFVGRPPSEQEELYERLWLHPLELPIARASGSVTSDPLAMDAFIDTFVSATQNWYRMPSQRPAGGGIAAAVDDPMQKLFKFTPIHAGRDDVSGRYVSIIEDIIHKQFLTTDRAREKGVAVALYTRFVSYVEVRTMHIEAGAGVEIANSLQDMRAACAEEVLKELAVFYEQRRAQAGTEGV